MHKLRVPRNSCYWFAGGSRNLRHHKRHTYCCKIMSFKAVCYKNTTWEGATVRLGITFSPFTRMGGGLLCCDLPISLSILLLIPVFEGGNEQPAHLLQSSSANARLSKPAPGCWSAPRAHGAVCTHVKVVIRRDQNVALHMRDHPWDANRRLLCCQRVELREHEAESAHHPQIFLLFSQVFLSAPAKARQIIELTFRGLAITNGALLAARRDQSLVSWTALANGAKPTHRGSLRCLVRRHRLICASVS
jgi:hypothetical protein